MSRVARIDRMRWLVASVAAVVAACSSPPVPPTPASPRNDTKPDSSPIVDSHVHLAFYPVADQLAAHGVGAAVDLASPESALATKYPIRLIRSGPMLTHPGGYPLDAWGSDGYGIGCDSNQCVTQTIERLQRAGAGVIKIALDDDGLPPRLVVTAVKEAHDRGMKVVVHALTDDGAFLAGKVGADVLAHTPVQSLSDATISEWRVPANLQGEKHERAVISTLAAFGGSSTAIDNLRRLRAAGVTVLYGTDLGNLRVDGPSAEEMALMKQAGMTDEDVQNAMTTVPWHFWGFDAMGPVPGKPASGQP